MYYKNTKVLETELKQRAFDGKWELLGRIFDKENEYSYTNEAGSTFYLIPTKWITLNVYDYLMEFQDV